MKRILLTGCGGFIGAHCLEYFLEKTDWQIVGLDSFRHKGSLSRLDAVHDRHLSSIARRGDFQDRVQILYHDLSVPIDPQLEARIGSIDVVVNMASDSAVERSTKDPVACLRNNYDLAINMLEWARRSKPSLFLQISTDEVYGEARNDAHKEWDVILPSNPYAASKAAQEAVAIAYWRTFDVPVVLSNCMNIVGEWQDPEKFLPKIIQCIARGQEIPIYADICGEEANIGSRFYLHARNKADALIFLANRQQANYADGADRPDRFNICGDVELDNLQMAQLIAEIMGKELKYKLVQSESARRGYDRRYALDGSKLRELGWVPPLPFRESVERLVRYTLDHPHWMA